MNQATNRPRAWRLDWGPRSGPGDRLAVASVLDTYKHLAQVPIHAGFKGFWGPNFKEKYARKSKSFKAAFAAAFHQVRHGLPGSKFWVFYDCSMVDFL